MDDKKSCQNCKKEFLIEPDDFTFYEKIGVPAPTWCPECRLLRRMLWRNERNFYRRKCDLCSKDMISTYPETAVFPVYCQKCWWSDKWDPLSYGREVDVSRDFLEQVHELFQSVPALSIQNDDGVGSVNSEWAYDFAFSKNVYMCVCGWYDENAMFSYYACYDKDISDCYYVYESELCCELVTCGNCYHSSYSVLCFDCNDIMLSYDLRGCSNCVLCVGLRSKQYCIRNEQYSKEDYAKKIAEMGLDRRENIEKYQQELAEFHLKFPRKFAYNLKSVNCSGNLISDSKNSHHCFYAGELENSSFMLGIDGAKDCYDCNNTGKPELCYESVTPDNSRGNKFSVFCWKCTEAEYSNNCHSCVSVLGSSGLKHASYAILNKQYPKEEFLALRNKIIAGMRERGQWGEFFPPSMSPFPYNKTAAREWIPMTREQAIAKGFRWEDEEERHYEVTMKSEQVPQTIGGTADSILQEVIGCAHGGTCDEKCTTAFRIPSQQLQLHRRLNLPLSTLCPNCRHYQRIKQRNPCQLWHRKCANCDNEFETSYSPERKEIVYCESCYQAEVQ